MRSSDWSSDVCSSELGSYTSSTRAFSLPDRGSVPACEPVCKTRAPKANNEAALDGVVGAKQNVPTGYDTFFPACTADNQYQPAPREERSEERRVWTVCVSMCSSRWSPYY